jgi:Holliday junction resolvase-like predicted endonuclease
MDNITQIFNGLVVTDHAKTAQREIVKYLKGKGYKCNTEVEVNYRNDGHIGRIDIIAEKDSSKLAIEVDRKSPRKKSIAKLLSICDYQRLILLRIGNESYCIDNIHILSLGRRSS